MKVHLKICCNVKWVLGYGFITLYYILSIITSSLLNFNQIKILYSEQRPSQMQYRKISPHNLNCNYYQLIPSKLAIIKIQSKR